MSSLNTVVFSTFIVGTVFTLIFKVARILSMPKGKGPDQWKAIVRYCFLYYALNIGIMITEPYVFQRMLDSSLTPEEMTSIFAAPLIIKSVVKFIPLRVIKMTGVAPLLIASGALASIATLLRTKKHFDTLCVAQVAIAMAREAFSYAMSDWKLGEGSHEKTSDAFFNAVVSAVHVVMATILAFVSKYLKTYYEDKQIFFVGTIICLIIIPSSLITIKKKPYPFRHQQSKPGISGIAIILFFTFLETYFVPRIQQYITCSECVIPLEYLFALTLTMTYLAETIVTFFDFNNKAVYILAASMLLLAIISLVIHISFESKPLIFILLMVGTILTKIGRLSLDHIGNTPIENTIIAVSFTYLSYKLFSFDVKTNVKICVGSALLTFVSSIVHLYKGNDPAVEELQQNLL